MMRVGSCSANSLLPIQPRSAAVIEARVGESLARYPKLGQELVIARWFLEHRGRRHGWHACNG